MDSEGGGGREISFELEGGQHTSSEQLYSQHLPHGGVSYQHRHFQQYLLTPV